MICWMGQQRNRGLLDGTTEDPWFVGWDNRGTVVCFLEGVNGGFLF